MNMMPCRYETLKYMLAGFAKTRMQLVGYNGSSLFPSDGSDDMGMYYFVPKVARLFDLTLDQAICLFFYGMIIFSLLLALTGFFLLSRSWLFRIIATVVLISFSYIACRGITDVYLVKSFIVLAVVPLALYFLRRNKGDIFFGFFLFLSGIGIGYVHYIRTYSSVAVLLFILLGMALLFKATWKNKMVLVAILFVGMMVPFIHFNILVHKRKRLFNNQEQLPGRHVFWHNFYAGFGFLQNNLGIQSSDEMVINKVKEVDSNAVYPTRSYEKVVRSQVFVLLNHHLHFVLTTLFAKLGVIFYYFLIFANIGLLAAFFYRKSWQIELMFWSGIAFNSLFGFLALPGTYYLLGMLAFAVIYSLVSIELAIGCWRED